jgi:hypothetical protein
LRGNHPQEDSVISRPRALATSLSVRLALAASSALLLFAASASAATFNYPDFSSTAGLQLNGSAIQNGNVLQLTPAEPSKIGTAFSTTPIDPQQSFETYFGISMHDSTSIAPADGMAFVIQSSPHGASAMSPSIGGSLGYNGITPSLAVEVDPFHNPEAGDPLYPHVSINTGTTGAHASCAVVNPTPAPPCNAALPFPIYGSPLHTWVRFDAATGHLKVFISQTPTQPSTPILDHPVSMGPLGNAAFIGFTASTGGATAVHDVLNWRLGPEETATAPAPPVGPLKKPKPKCPKGKGKKDKGKAKGKAGASAKGKAKGKGKGKGKGKKCDKGKKGPKKGKGGKKRK